MTANVLYIEKEARRMARDAKLTKMPFLSYLLEMAADEAKREAISREQATGSDGRIGTNPSEAPPAHRVG
ncbi:hypothetical protein LB518_09950 [Mesorhizobium sp. BR1-1-16]|uniref:hypothetical protein n=1 Tax=Mesorhizobium sp. BR1-1-16 TaxID=2876653 RepID=UPI001CCE30EE|nr:hypothetical protein [Mesorhizobium sp. BR1-1-16]MBZ9936618.1 hypothetical protein [Mesorhizobium sp. BR1-1-16]